MAYRIVNGVAFMELRTRDPLFYQFYCCPDKRGQQINKDRVYFCSFHPLKRELGRKTEAGRQFIERPDWCPCFGMSLAEMEEYRNSDL
jgi:hypothetical protein